MTFKHLTYLTHYSFNKTKIMKPKKPNIESSKSQSDRLDKLNYPQSEDIFNKFTEEQDIDPEDVSKKKPVIKPRNDKWNEKSFGEDVSGSDLDIPGSELDDATEKIGSEDEENNGYSIGGDNHNDLEEDNVEE
ncbi:MAG: hypothetical protein ABI554_09050 [Flavobacterium sp.]